METKINLSDDLSKDLKKVLDELGIEESSEFIEEAVREKILELRKKRFFEISNEVSERLTKNNVSKKDILENFSDKK